jgi:hypothetical protein
MRLKITLEGLEPLAGLTKSIKGAEMLKYFDKPVLAGDGGFYLPSPLFHFGKLKREWVAEFRYNFRHGRAKLVTMHERRVMLQVHPVETLSSQK